MIQPGKIQPMSQGVPPTPPAVLAIDDAGDIREFVAKALGPEFKVITAADGASGLQIAQAAPNPDLILLDVMMTDMDGYKVCKALKENPATLAIPVIFLTALSDVSDEVMGFQLGAVDYITKPVSPLLLKSRVSAHVALFRRRRELNQAVKDRTSQLERANQQLIHRLARVVEHHEGPSFKNHALRVSQYLHLIATAAGAKAAVVEMMVKGAPLYDIGKLAVPTRILRKTTDMDDAETKLFRRHAALGAEIIGDHSDPVLRLARTMASTHHERWDGKGYPDGLKGESIPWAGRAMAIVDEFESLTTTQYRRDALSVDAASAQIERGSGSVFDPALVKAFKAALPAMRKVRDKLSDSLAEILDLDFTSAS